MVKGVNRGEGTLEQPLHKSKREGVYGANQGGTAKLCLVPIWDEVFFYPCSSLRLVEILLMYE